MSFILEGVLSCNKVDILFYSQLPVPGILFVNVILIFVVLWLCIFICLFDCALYLYQNCHVCSNCQTKQDHCPPGHLKNGEPYFFFVELNDEDGFQEAILSKEAMTMSTFIDQYHRFFKIGTRGTRILGSGLAQERTISVARRMREDGQYRYQYH